MRDGPARFDEAFWGRCLDALAPGGCLATNWADFATNKAVRPMAEAQSAVARARGLDTYYVTRRGFRDNLIQYLPTGAERRTRGDHRRPRPLRARAPPPRPRPRHPRTLHRSDRFPID